jgi:hypothetical protein
LDAAPIGSQAWDLYSKRLCELITHKAMLSIR